MDFIKNLANKSTDSTDTSGAGLNQGNEASSGGGFMDKVHGALGGGKSSEANEDFLDKGVDFLQERMGGGPQDNENAIEQAKDEQISDAIRRGYKSATGSDFPISDKS